MVIIQINVHLDVDPEHHWLHLNDDFMCLLQEYAILKNFDVKNKYLTAMLSNLIKSKIMLEKIHHKYILKT